VLKLSPSEYFDRQVYLGSSLFSKIECERREEIGVGKMLLGTDYPHHEGTWGAGPGTATYYQATLGAARVPAADARRMMGGNAIDVFGLDRDKLATIAERIGPTMDQILTPPTVDHYPRGDVKKPLGGAAT
jgi:hypothetical protein